MLLKSEIYIIYILKSRSKAKKATFCSSGIDIGSIAILTRRRVIEPQANLEPIVRSSIQQSPSPFE